MAAESESFPEDEEVGPGVALGSQAGLAGQEGAEVGSLFFLPRAIREVFPEFPARLRGKVRGVVELMLRIGPTGEVEEVLVVRNTTGSQELEKAAVEAARRCVFVAPRDQYGRPVSVWAPKVYAFE
ncbi:MAG: energy transducer TonB [candidate division KSB1 bacterium]|nr:energy transducer TonB [candidate division KSB1 bacterium]